MNTSDFKTLNNVLEAYRSSVPLHNQIVRQTLAYSDMAENAKHGTYDKKSLSNEHISPLLFSMFLPRFQMFETRILLSNLGQIVSNKKKGLQITTSPNFELLFDLKNDPNDIVCDKNSTIQDIYLRTKLQQVIWENVINLRDNKYYGPWGTRFELAVHNCTASTYNMPDIMSSKNILSQFHRIMSAFSIRSIVTQTIRMGGIPNASGIRGFGNKITNKINSIPYMVLNLPYLNDTNNKVNLEDAIEQEQLYMNNGALFKGVQSIVYVRDILPIVVNRTINSINVSQYYEPLQYNRLPIAINGLEKINPTKVISKNDMPIQAHNYCLRSIVCVELDVNLENVVNGSFCYVLDYKNDGPIFDPKIYNYSPGNVNNIGSSDKSKHLPLPLSLMNTNEDEIKTHYTKTSQEQSMIFFYQSKENMEFKYNLPITRKGFF
jgi:hypothetical protein